MSAFREHFIDRYFAYRRRYVDHMVGQAPERARLAVLSEVARLGFVAFGSALCALILGALTFGAAGRSTGFPLWPVVFGVMASFATVGALAALTGIVTALADRPRVQARIAK